MIFEIDRMIAAFQRGRRHRRKRSKPIQFDFSALSLLKKRSIAKDNEKSMCRTEFAEPNARRRRKKKSILRSVTKEENDDVDKALPLSLSAA